MLRSHKTYPITHDRNTIREFYSSQEISNFAEAPIVKKRKCTDTICLVVFISFIGVWSFVAITAFKYGNLKAALYPTDSFGNICGWNEMSELPFLMIFDLTECLNPGAVVTGCNSPQVCVKNCPVENFTPLKEAIVGKESEESIKNKLKPFCSFYTTEKDYNSLTVSQLIDKQYCPPWYLASSSIMGRCIPVVQNVDKDIFAEVLLKAVQSKQDKMEVNQITLQETLRGLNTFLHLRNFCEKIISDLTVSWWLILLSLVGACFFSLIWMMLMRCISIVMVWVSIISVLFLLGLTVTYSTLKLHGLYLKGTEKTDNNVFQVNWTSQFLSDILYLKQTWIVITIISSVALVTILFVLIYIRQRIILAITLIEQSSKAVGQLYSTLFFPIIPFVCQLIVFVMFLTVYLYINTSKLQDFRIMEQRKFENIQQDCSSNTECPYNETTLLGSNSFLHNSPCDPVSFIHCQKTCPKFECKAVNNSPLYGNRSFLFHLTNLLGLYWGLFFFKGFSHMVLAMVFAKWYWTFDKRDHGTDLSLSVGRSVCTVITFHLGTLALGSLVLAAVRLVIVLLQFLQRRVKNIDNCCTRCFIPLCKCCMWCLEKFLKFINYNAYIICAMKSTNFCTSAQTAYNLLMRNLVRIIVLDSVCGFLLFLGKILIVILASLSTYFAIFGLSQGNLHFQVAKMNLHYLYTPVIFAAIGSYIIASCFFSVYTVAVDTLFLCLLEDLERNDGSQSKPYFMSKKLRTLVVKQSNSSRHGQVFTVSEAFTQ